MILFRIEGNRIVSELGRSVKGTLVQLTNPPDLTNTVHFGEISTYVAAWIQPGVPVRVTTHMREKMGKAINQTRYGVVIQRTDQQLEIHETETLEGARQMAFASPPSTPPIPANTGGWDDDPLGGL